MYVRVWDDGSGVRCDLLLLACYVLISVHIRVDYIKTITVRFSGSVGGAMLLFCDDHCDCSLDITYGANVGEQGLAQLLFCGRIDSHDKVIDARSLVHTAYSTHFGQLPHDAWDKRKAAVDKNKCRNHSVS